MRQLKKSTLKIFYHTWERVLNKNTNDLLRCFYPKGMAIADMPEIKIEQAQFMINTRLRKALNCSSTYEFITGKHVSLIAGL
jgi:IS30 family transposase